MAKTPRNAPCPCGSGRRYKSCCEATDLVIRHQDRQLRDHLDAYAAQARATFASLGVDVGGLLGKTDADRATAPLLRHLLLHGRAADGRRAKGLALPELVAQAVDTRADGLSIVTATGGTPTRPLIEDLLTGEADLPLLDPRQSLRGPAGHAWLVWRGALVERALGVFAAHPVGLPLAQARAVLDGATTAAPIAGIDAGRTLITRWHQTTTGLTTLDAVVDSELPTVLGLALPDD
jgi:hypothetical protein